MESQILERLQQIRKAWEQSGVLSTEETQFLLTHVSSVDVKVREVIDLLAQTRNTFRSKQIERARKLLEELL
jgi:hypothetical protein